MDNAPTQDIEGKDDDQRGSGCQNGSAEGFIDTLIHGFFKWFSPETPQVLPYPIEHNNRVIERISHDGQKCRNNGKGYLPFSEGEKAHGDNHIVYNGNDGTQCVFEIQKQTERKRYNEGNDNKPGDADAESGGNINHKSQDIWP